MTSQSSHDGLRFNLGDFRIREKGCPWSNEKKRPHTQTHIHTHTHTLHETAEKKQGPQGGFRCQLGSEMKIQNEFEFEDTRKLAVSVLRVPGRQGGWMLGVWED